MWRNRIIITLRQKASLFLFCDNCYEFLWYASCSLSFDKRTLWSLASLYYFRWEDFWGSNKNWSYGQGYWCCWSKFASVLCYQLDSMTMSWTSSALDICSLWSCDQSLFSLSCTKVKCFHNFFAFTFLLNLFTGIFFWHIDCILFLYLVG